MSRPRIDPPRAPIHRRMSLEEYRDYPRHPGWKYEYLAGALHVTSAYQVVPMVLDLAARRPAAGRELPGIAIRLLEPRDDPDLVDLFVESFTGAMEYAASTPGEIRRSAEESLERGPRKRRGPRHEVSYVGESAGGELVGAALFRSGHGAPLLDLLFVAPRYRRRDLARVLAETAIHDLARLGESAVRSTAMLGNVASLAWHRRFGFQEMPHYLVAKHRRHIYGYELERHRRLCDLPASEIEALEARAAYWQAESERLTELLAKNPEAAFPNIY